MGGYSYQDIETRLRTVESMLEFMMKAFGVESRYEHPLQPGQTIVERRTMLDQYRAMKGLGLRPEDISGVPEVTSEVAAPVAAEQVNG